MGKEMDIYKQRNGYNYEDYVTDMSEDEDYNLKVTEPGQAISIKQLVERYEKGRKYPPVVE